MFELIDNSPVPIAEPEEICFEQPVTERMRTFLRLEFLYDQARFHRDNESDFSARATVSSILEIMAILGRGDVRAEVLKDLERQTERLANFRRMPGVDGDRLNRLIANLDSHKSDLTDIGSHFLQPLKDCDFLSAIKHRSAIPGGTCTFDLPDFGYWLNLPFAQRTQQITEWLQSLGPLCDSVSELLWLTREAGESVNCLAEAGFYQHNLDRNTQLNLIRIHVAKSAGAFPAISAGRHRFSVRFVEWQGIERRPVQTTNDVHFSLMLS